ncbi:SPFH domain, Band 7 family protein [Candidatus Magnetomorum sp. HK-1]|nr:SPFH domain, Band 7 family protein [Candidatus Magnetomorum sp. HK-1]
MSKLLSNRFIVEKRPLIILGFLLFSVLIAYLWSSIVIIVRSGEGGVIYRLFLGGTVVNRVYGEGLHVIFPWDTMFVYNCRVQEVKHDMHVLSKNGLRLDLEISIRFYPEYNMLGVLHKKLGPDYVETVVIPEIESVLRIIIGKIEAEEVYSTKTSLIEKALNESIEQVAQRFINIDDVIIKRLLLPPHVEKAIFYKLQKKHLAGAHDFIIKREVKEAKRRVIEAHGLAKYNKILGASINKNIIMWKGIDASLKLSESNNSKVVMVGNGNNGLPIFGGLFLDQQENLTSSQFSSLTPTNNDQSFTADQFFNITQTIDLNID